MVPFLREVRKEGGGALLTLLVGWWDRYVALAWKDENNIVAQLSVRE